MTRPIRVRRRSLLAAALTATMVALIALPASASFPDQGSRVLFARAKAPPPTARGIVSLDQFTMKQNGEDQTRVRKTDEIAEYGGHWSPNGGRIVFTGSKGKGNIHVYTTSATGTNRKQLTSGATANFSPNWSRNGDQIVWTRFSTMRPDGRTPSAAEGGSGANLMVMNADGTDKHSIWSGTALAPGWSPVSGRIAFSTHDGDSLDVWWIKPNGLDLEQLTDFGDSTYSIFGDWAPDGASFVIAHFSGVARGGSGYDLYRATPEGTKPIFLAADADPEFSPMFTADGSRVVFVRDDGDDLEVYSVKADGSGGEKQLTDNAGDDLLSVVPLI